MRWIVLAIGLLIALLGWAIGRVKLVKRLSGTEPGKLIDPAKAARYAAHYLTLLGGCFMALSYFIETMSDRSLIGLMACFIPLNMVVVVGYLPAQSRNMNERGPLG